MAQTFPEKPTTQDLSHLPENQGFPAYNGSMAGGNMITKKNPHFAGQGTDSEGSHDVVSGDISWIGDAQDTVNYPGASDESCVDTKTHGEAGSAPRISPWKEL